MQVIHFSDPSLGSMDWELPQELADKISLLPKELQKFILEDLEKNIKAILHLLQGALLMGSKTPLAFAIIEENQVALTEQLIKLCKET